MDCESFDKGAVQYVVCSTNLGMRFFSSAALGNTHEFNKADTFRDAYDAHVAAEKMNACPSHRGMKWHVTRRIMGGEYLD